MRSILVRLAIFLAGTFAPLVHVAAAESFTDSQAGDFAMGRRFMSCAAFFDFAAELAAGMDKPSASEHFKNLSNGWTLAGALLLASGAAKPNFDAKQTADSIRRADLTALKAKYEMGGTTVMKDMQADHQRDCDPLAPMQEGIIQALRQQAPTPAGRK